eukprot:363865-Chlamydomonas_euryale.AAC.14
MGLSCDNDGHLTKLCCSEDVAGAVECTARVLCKHLVEFLQYLGLPGRLRPPASARQQAKDDLRSSEPALETITTMCPLVQDGFLPAAVGQNPAHPHGPHVALLLGGGLLCRASRDRRSVYRGACAPSHLFSDMQGL